MNDWIEWNGGECPVDEKLMVFIRFGHGAESDEPVMARHVYWNNDLGEHRTIAYRIAEQVTDQVIMPAIVMESAQQMAQKQRDERVSETVATINIDDALDELSDMMSIWITNRQNGRTPRHIKTAIISMIKEIAAQ